MPKLTKRIVDAAETQAAEYFVWDSDIPGFGLRVLPSGRKGYVVQYRAGRRSRRISLGIREALQDEGGFGQPFLDYCRGPDGHRCTPRPPMAVP
jgi:hypothetical protein